MSDRIILNESFLTYPFLNIFDQIC